MLGSIAPHFSNRVRASMRTMDARLPLPLGPIVSGTLVRTDVRDFVHTSVAELRTTSMRFDAGDLAGTDEGRAKFNHLGRVVMLVLEEFALTVSGKKQKASEYNYVLPHKVGLQHLYADELMTNLMTLGVREEEGSVNMNWSWRHPFGSSLDEIVITFTLSRGCLSPILLKDEVGTDGRTTRPFETGGFWEKHILNKKWAPLYRNEVRHILTTVLRCSTIRSDQKNVQHEINGMLCSMLKNLTTLLEQNESKFDWKYVEVYSLKDTKDTLFQVAKVVQKDFDFQLAFEERAAFLDLLCSKYYKGTWFQKCQRQEVMDRIQALMIQAAEFNPDRDSMSHLALHTAELKSVGLSDSVQTGLGFSSWYVHKDLRVHEEERRNVYVGNSFTPFRHETQTRMELKRSWFSILKVSICVGEYSSAYYRRKIFTSNAMEKSKIVDHQFYTGCDAAWLFREDQSVYTPDVRMRATAEDTDRVHYEWWSKKTLSNDQLDNFKIVSELKFRVRIEMEDKRKTSRFEDCYRVGCDVIFILAEDMEREMGALIAHVNAAAMKQKLENDLFESPQRLTILHTILKDDLEQVGPRALKFVPMKKTVTEIVTIGDVPWITKVSQNRMDIAPIEIRTLYEESPVLKRRREEDDDIFAVLFESERNRRRRIAEERDLDVALGDLYEELSTDQVELESEELE
jgi:hypothetical protein